MKVVEVNGVGDLPVAAREIVAAAQGRNVVALYGQMGAGKTTLITEICSLLGVTERVTSPTFALVNEYEAESGRAIYHFDVYRINKIDEIFDMGYEEYFYSDGLSLIEWPELIEPLLPDDTLNVKIEVVDQYRRRISF